MYLVIEAFYVLHDMFFFALEKSVEWIWLVNWFGLNSAQSWAAALAAVSGVNTEGEEKKAGCS